MSKRQIQKPAQPRPEHLKQRVCGKDGYPVIPFVPHEGNLRRTPYDAALFNQQASMHMRPARSDTPIVTAPSAMYLLRLICERDGYLQALRDLQAYREAVTRLVGAVRQLPMQPSEAAWQTVRDAIAVVEQAAT